MNKQLIGNIIRNVSTAIDPRDVRWSLNHMRVLCKPDRLIFTGTDGVKLIEKTYFVETGWDNEVFIPGALAKGYAELGWYGIRNIRNNLAPMMYHNALVQEGSPDLEYKYPNYERLFTFSHRKGNIRQRIDRQTCIDSLRSIICSLDREDNCRFTLSRCGWHPDTDVNGLFLYQLLKALHSDKLLVRYDNRHKYITLIGDYERALLSMLMRRGDLQ
jgi:hypothetical protein